ncbi:MAG: hypothetical protein B6U69_00705 [Thermofilum sp. ex4484_15]|nr:MAG: hypothetical protein B6U69_00705 [Thermofilum sp. ex4484_15]
MDEKELLRNSIIIHHIVSLVRGYLSNYELKEDKMVLPEHCPIVELCKFFKVYKGGDKGLDLNELADKIEDYLQDLLLKAFKSKEG